MTALFDALVNSCFTGKEGTQVYRHEDGGTFRVYRTIGTAVNDTAENGRIFVAPGTYAETSIPAGKKLEIVGAAFKRSRRWWQFWKRTSDGAFLRADGS